MVKKSVNDITAYITVFGLILLVIGLGGGLYVVSKGIERALVEDTQTTVIDISDITDLPDEYNTTEETDDGGVEDDPLDDGDDDTTIIEDPTDEDDDNDPETPPVYDHSFSGDITVKAEIIGVSGNPLAFVKEMGGESIDKLKIRYDWDFKLGKDLDPSTFTIKVTGKIKKFYYQDMIDTWNKGSLAGGTIFTAYGFDLEGWDTQTFDIESTKLGFIQVEHIGSETILITTSTNTFVLEWEALVSTDGGVAKKIIGQTGIALRIIYISSQADWFTPDPDDANMQQWYGDVWGKDPQTPLMSIVVR